MAALEALLGMFALPQPAAIMASLKGDTSSEELLHRWVHFPAVLPANDQLEQKLQQRKQALPKPHLMQLPNQFQVCYTLLTTLEQVLIPRPYPTLMSLMLLFVAACCLCAIPVEDLRWQFIGSAHKPSWGCSDKAILPETEGPIHRLLPCMPALDSMLSLQLIVMSLGCIYLLHTLHTVPQERHTNSNSKDISVG